MQDPEAESNGAQEDPVDTLTGKMDEETLDLFRKHARIADVNSDRMTLAMTSRTETGAYVVEDFGVEPGEDGKMDVALALSQVVFWRGCYGYAGAISCNGPSTVVLFPGVSMESFLSLIDKNHALPMPMEDYGPCTTSTPTE